MSERPGGRRGWGLGLSIPGLSVGVDQKWLDDPEVRRDARARALRLLFRPGLKTGQGEGGVLRVQRPAPLAGLGHLRNRARG